MSLVSHFWSFLFVNHWQIKGLISFPFICVSYATGGNKGKAHFFCIRRIWCALIMATTHITLNKLEHTFFFLSSQFAENIIAVMSCNRRIGLIPELCQTSVNFQVLKWDFTAAQVHSAVSHVLGAATCFIMLFLWDVKWEEKSQH